ESSTMRTRGGVTQSFIWDSVQQALYPPWRHSQTLPNPLETAVPVGPTVADSSGARTAAHRTCVPAHRVQGSGFKVQGSAAGFFDRFLRTKLQNPNCRTHT